MARRHYTPEQSQQLRERIAREAARLIVRGKAKGFHAARMRAMRWLSQGKLSSAEIPTQEEITRELEALTLTSDWDQLSRINWLAVQTYRWLEPCQPLVQIDWHRSASSHGIRLHWLIATERQTLLERLLLDRKLSFKRRLLEPSVVQYEFHDQLPQTVFVLGDHSTGNDQELPVNLTISGVGYQFNVPPFDQGDDKMLENENVETSTTVDQEHFDSGNLAVVLRPLLEALAGVERDYATHPEGNVLYHSLQVFQRGQEQHPWDEEFLWACLLHDLGWAIDPRDPQTAMQRFLQGRVSERVWFLLTELPAAHEILQGMTARKSLRKDESYEELLDLARHDRAGRLQGIEVPTLEDALAYLADLSGQWDDI